MNIFNRKCIYICIVYIVTYTDISNILYHFLTTFSFIYYSKEATVWLVSVFECRAFKGFPQVISQMQWGLPSLFHLISSLKVSTITANPSLLLRGGSSNSCSNSNNSNSNCSNSHCQWQLQDFYMRLQRSFLGAKETEVTWASKAQGNKWEAKGVWRDSWRCFILLKHPLGAATSCYVSYL